MHRRRWGVAGLAIALAACAGPDPSPSASAAPSFAVAPIPLLDPGAQASFDGVDDDGAWGTITVRRGDDTGGYPTSAVDPDNFIIEVHVEYAFTRDSEAVFGGMDWALVTAADRRPAGGAFTPDEPRHPWEIWDLTPLPAEATTANIAVEPRTMSGWLFFEVPRSLADEALELAYRPAHLVEAVTFLGIRDVGAAPDPVSTATPEPRPAKLAYVPSSVADLDVIDDPEAKNLFVDADTARTRSPATPSPIRIPGTRTPPPARSPRARGSVPSSTS